MRYAIFSDVHANLTAWEAVRRDISQREVDVLVCLGDVVGYGPRPMEVLAGIMAVTPNILMGNHDAAAVGAMDCSIFNERAQRSTEWTAQALTEEARTFLASLPMAIESEGILFVHAEVCQPERFGYINGPVEALANFLGGKHRITFVGHTHYPKLFEWSGVGEVLEFAAENRTLDPEMRYIVNVGSVGEPRDANDIRARYVIYDSDCEGVEFHAVEFDIPAYRADLERTSLGIKPYFLHVFEQSAEDTRGSLCEEEPVGRLLLPAGRVPITERLQLNSTVDHGVLKRRPAVGRSSAASAQRGKGNRGAKVLVIGCALLVMGMGVWFVISSHRRSSKIVRVPADKVPPLIIPVTPAGSDAAIPTRPVTVSPAQVVASTTPELEKSKPIEKFPILAGEPSIPEVISSLPKMVKTTGTGAGLNIAVLAVGDKAPKLDNSHGTLELAYNFGYSGSEISQDGIKFQSVTHNLVANPVYGTTHGITVKGSSSGASQNFNCTDLGDDLWQTITYTDRGDDLRLEVTGLVQAKAYQIQILLGEPRNNKTTLYHNGLITATDSSGASQSTRLTFGNADGDYALIRIEVAASASLMFDMPKAGLGPGVAGIVIHSAPLTGR